ncbi:magnetosome protein Mad28-1 [Candidatus Magnetobacterium bavaricum]|uniref:Magnetosome protein Mad28-1 n=1 Tax=Candidatus Magnetobacterium bavaricum TaxID=29290 RepID=A0A0F3GQM5_9BACT|nr:magnetosome protein Mad28-1 [Candidatus Magnetobacterium bavaricum]
MADEFNKFQDELKMLRDRIKDMEAGKQASPVRQESPVAAQAPAYVPREEPPMAPTQQRPATPEWPATPERTSVPERAPMPEPSRSVSTDTESPKGPVGLDLGTSNIVMAQNKGGDLHIAKQLNAFFPVVQSKFTKKILTQNNVLFVEKNKLYYVLGYSAEGFANMFNENTRRPMEKGLLSSKEDDGITIIQAIIGTVVKRPKNFGEYICFSIPGIPLDNPTFVAGYESIIKMYLGGLGYTPISVNEALAVVMEELGDDNFTGIGISMGGGMCNVCLSYLSVPVITFSIQRGGDYIDAMVSREIGEPATKVKVTKEEALDLSALPRNRMETLLHVYYMDLINTLVENLRHVISSSEHIPKISAPIPIVLSGGTAMPKGFKDKFDAQLRMINMPIDISEVRMAKDPLNTIAKGALKMAMTVEA